MIKHAHNEFVSDIFTMLLTIGTRIVVANSSSQVEGTLQEFLNYDMRRQVIVKLILPQWDKNTTLYGAYKVSKVCNC